MPVESNPGRGANRNPTPTRFNLQERLAEGEWLDQVEAIDGVAPRRTSVTATGSARSSDRISPRTSA